MLLTRLSSILHQNQMLGLSIINLKTENMKKTLGIIALLFAVNTATFAQREKEGKERNEERNESKKHVKAPVAVITAFAKDFPGTSGKWEKEGNEYEVNFKQNGKTMSALYDANGNKVETEMDIKVSDLPAAVTVYLAQHYKGAKVKEAAVITKANGEINYEAEVKGMDVLFTKDGKFIKTAKD